MIIRSLPFFLVLLVCLACGDCDDYNAVVMAEYANDMLGGWYLPSVWVDLVLLWGGALPITMIIYVRTI